MAFTFKRPSYIFDDIKYYVGKCIVFDCSEIIKNNLKPNLDNSGYLEIQNKDAEEQAKRYLDIVKSLEISSDYFKQKLKDNFGIKSIGDLKDYFIIFYTGLDKYWNEEIYVGQEWRFAYFLNPYLSQDLMIEISNSGIKGIGSDTYRLENPLLNLGSLQASELFGISVVPESIKSEFNKINEQSLLHYIFLNKNILIIENLTNLERINNDISLFVALPPRIQVNKASSDMFVRAIAFKLANPEIPSQKSKGRIY